MVHSIAATLSFGGTSWPGGIGGDSPGFFLARLRLESSTIVSAAASARRRARNCGNPPGEAFALGRAITAPPRLYVGRLVSSSGSFKVSPIQTPTTVLGEHPLKPGLSLSLEPGIRS